MTDRERLIDLIKKSEKQELLDFFTADLDEAIDMSGGTQFNGTVEYLADYLLANGVIVPPCKLGDTVWFIRNNEIIETCVEKIILKHGGLYIKLCCNSMYETTCNSIGKTVFLTREKAEQALKKLKQFEAQKFSLELLTKRKGDY